MSADNVWTQLGRNSPTLQAKLESNLDLSNFVMGLLGRLIIMSQERGAPFEGIMFSDIQADGQGEFRARVSFSTLNVGTIGEIPDRSDFFMYAQSRSHNMAVALAKSGRLNRFFQSIVEFIDKYSIEKGIPFGALKVRQGIISPDGMLVLKVGRDILNA